MVLFFAGSQHVLLLHDGFDGHERRIGISAALAIQRGLHLAENTPVEARQPENTRADQRGPTVKVTTRSQDPHKRRMKKRTRWRTEAAGAAVA